MQRLLWILCFCGSFLAVNLSTPSWADESADVPPPGHSAHGQIFNEGPRQAAFLMPGMPKINFPVTTQNKEVQAFINQGVGQIHGFWYFEAERSFRQAAKLDPDCAIAYWGMALANVDNAKRATGFIEEADKRKDKVSERERMYIEALSAFIKTGSKKNKERYEAYLKAFDKILYKYPDDIEARALLALHLWKARDAGMPVQSFIAVDAVLDQVFRVDPMHPAHHYRIHLWDAERPENAVASSALCGQSAAGIAHMWHMPGHIFSRLQRYEDACWQQEASARVDHAHMMRDRVLPDQIHNFAHNNEWFIRNLNFVGRGRDAVELAKNMCELPQHPKYNTLEKKGSNYYGRLRLIESLTRFQLWDELLALAETPYFDANDSESEQIRRLKVLGMAAYRKGDAAKGDEYLAQLKERREKKLKEQATAEAEAEAKLTPKPKEEPKKEETKPAEAIKEEPKAETAAKTGCEEEKKPNDEPKAEEKKPEEKKPEEKKTEEKKETPQPEPVKPAEVKKEEKPSPPRDEKAITKAKEEARKKFEPLLKELEKAIQELEGHQAIAAEDYKKGYDLLKKSGGIGEGYLAQIQFRMGEKEPAEKAIRKFVDSKKNEVLPRVELVDFLWRAEKKEEAKKEFETLRKLAGRANIDLPVFTRLAPIAKELEYPDDWRLPQEPAKDVGNRPALDSLGPYRWSPWTAPSWTLKDNNGKEHSLSDYRGRPVVLIFFLGNGCLHCAEQLHAFAKMKADFDAAGLPLLAISSDDSAGLKKSIENYTGGALPIPLVSDNDLATFKAYRAYDDFENQTLHGTYIIDERGLIRWQDIGFEPFMDGKFVLKEAKRLLSFPKGS